MNKLKKNGSTVFLQVSKEVHFKLRQLAAIENKPVCQLVSEIIDESLARRRRGAKHKLSSPKPNLINWADKSSGIF